MYALSSGCRYGDTFGSSSLFWEFDACGQGLQASHAVDT